MARHVGSRIGYAVTSVFSGGIFNTFDNYFFRQGKISIVNIPTYNAPNGYTYGVFTSPGTVYISGNGTVDVLLVAGGGSSGSTLSAGGGAGGVVRHPSLNVTTGYHSIQVGTGGAAPAAQAPISGAGNNGTPSYIIVGLTSITANGGGAGAHYSGPTGNPGGSGGGGGNLPVFNGGNATQTTQPQSVNPGYIQYGNPGFNGGTNSSNVGAGGGGAGSGGPIATNGVNGGNGQPFPEFSYPFISPLIPAPMQPTFGPAVGPTGLYGGGGGAGARSGTTAGVGGPGGGGSGSSTTNGSPGINGTGGGGGAGSYPGPATNGAGGNGIVIIRYPT